MRLATDRVRSGEGAQEGGAHPGGRAGAPRHAAAIALPRSAAHLGGMRPRLILLALGFAASACASTPHAWQNPATGELAPTDVIDGCLAEAQREAHRSVFLYGWYGWGTPWVGWPWGPHPRAWGFGTGLGYTNLAFVQRTQELMAFCMRLKGFAWLPVRPATGAAVPVPDTAATQAKP